MDLSPEDRQKIYEEEKVRLEVRQALEQEAAARRHRYIEDHGKSIEMAIILTFFFGPFGLLYASVPGGILMMVVAFFCLIFMVANVAVGALLGFLGWIASIIWSVLAVQSSNRMLVPERSLDSPESAERSLFKKSRRFE